MPAARRPRRTRTEGLTELEWLFMVDAVPLDTASAEHWSLVFDDTFFRPGRLTVEAMWDAYGAEALRHVAQARPGRRPTLWWRFAAPELIRHRVGGTGTAIHEVRNHSLQLRLGVPVYWVTPECAAYSPDLAGHEVNPADPPLFESQAAYLLRHGLLSPAELSRLRPPDFRPTAFGWTAEDANPPTYSARSA